MITMSGSEFKRFYTEPLIWSDRTSWDDTLINVDGVSEENLEGELGNVADDAVVKIETGYLVSPPAGVPEDLIDAIEWWRAKQSTTEVMFRVPNERIDAVRQALAALGVELTMRTE